PILPVAAEVLPRRGRKAVPAALDVVRAARAVNQSERWPERMIAAENETLARASSNGPHAAPIRFDARRAPVRKMAAVHRPPEVRVELEVGAAPLTAHRAKDRFEMSLSLRVRAVQRVPGAAPPAAEGDAVRAQRRTLGVFD